MSEPAVPINSPSAVPGEWRERVMRKTGESVEVKKTFFDRYADEIGELSQKMAEISSKATTFG